LLEQNFCGAPPLPSRGVKACPHCWQWCSTSGSRIAITMDIYSHLMPNMQADAAAKVDAALRAAKKPT
jgi:hypothetical protein